MMTLLKQIGGVLAKGTQLVKTFGPAAKQFIPDQHDAKVDVVSDKLEQLTAVIFATEAAGQKINVPGMQRKLMAAPQVAQLILSLDVFAGRRIDQPEKFQRAMEGIAGHLADAANSFEPAEELTANDDYDIG